MRGTYKYKLQVTLFVNAIQIRTNKTQIYFHLTHLRIILLSPSLAIVFLIFSVGWLRTSVLSSAEATARMSASRDTTLLRVSLLYRTYIFFSIRAYLLSGLFAHSDLASYDVQFLAYYVQVCTFFTEHGARRRSNHSRDVLSRRSTIEDEAFFHHVCIIASA